MLGALLTVVLAGAGLAACTPGSTGPAPTTGDRSPASSTPAGTAASPSGAAPEPLPWGPLPQDLADAAELVSTWTPEQLAGGVLVARYAGTAASTPAALVSELHLAGVIVMGDNVEGADQVEATARAVREAAVADRRDWPPVLSVDQEGGRVARLTDEVTAFPTLMTAGAAVAGDAKTGTAAVTAASRAAGSQLRALGFTWVNAPVADVTIGPADPTIGSRSPAGDPALAGRVVAAAVEGYRQAGIVPVAKHYPGHGGVTTDSHDTLPVQEAGIDELRARDIVPFAAAARAGVPVVMMSHVAVDAFDAGRPATLSPAAYASLRSDAGFQGVAVTDALDMAAVTADHGTGGAAVAALAAGADVLLMPADVRIAHAAVVTAIEDGSVPRARAEEAAARVVALQRWQGRTVDQTPLGAGSTLATNATAASLALSAAGLTRVDGPCGTPLVSDTMRVVGGTRADRVALAAAASQAGIRRGPNGPVVRLVGSTGGAGGAADVVVALDTPYVLAGDRGRTATYALYGRTPSAFAALVDVLTGVTTAHGALPVAVDGLDVTPC